MGLALWTALIACADASQAEAPNTGSSTPQRMDVTTADFVSGCESSLGHFEPRALLPFLRPYYRQDSRLPPVHPFFDLEGVQSVQYTVRFLEQESSVGFFFDDQGLLVRIEQKVPEGGPIVDEYEYLDDNRLARHISRFAPTQDPRFIIDYTYSDSESGRVITATDHDTGAIISTERQTLDIQRCALTTRYEDLRYDEVWRRTFFFDGSNVPVGVRASSTGDVTVGPIDAELSWNDELLERYTEVDDSGSKTRVDFVYNESGLLVSFKEDLGGTVREHQIRERGTDARGNWSSIVFDVFEEGGTGGSEPIGGLEFNRTVTYRAK